MYGTLKTSDGLSDDSAANNSQQQQQQTANTLTQDNNKQLSTRSNGSLPENKKKKKRIYSHCHIQSVDDDNNQQHGHSSGPPAADKSARRRLIAASIICLVFMIAEVVGGVLSNSLAIATDAAHLLTDFASFMISLFALWLSSRPATRKMSFGWYRAEVIGALLSVLMIWLVTGLLVYMAIERLRTGEFEIDSLVMVITATGGLLVNIIMAIALNVDGHGHGHFHSHGGHSHGHGHAHNHDRDINNHSHLVHINDDDDDEQDDDEDDEQNDTKHLPESAVTQSQNSKSLNGFTKSDHLLLSSSSASSSDHTNGDKTKQKKKKSKQHKKCNGVDPNNSNGRGRSNINVRAAFIHVIGDFLQSLGVLIAALVIHFEPSYAIVDPICTFLFSIIVLVTTINIIRDALNVLMEGIPDGINFIEVREKLHSLPFVVRVHNLRIWSLSLDKVAISTHLVIDTSKTTSSHALKRAINELKSGYNFFEVTIQIEEFREDMKDCEQCQDEDDVAINMIEPNPIVDESLIRRNSSTAGGDGSLV